MSAGNLNSSPLLKMCIITSVWEVVFVMDLASSVIFKLTWNSFCYLLIPAYFPKSPMERVADSFQVDLVVTVSTSDSDAAS